MPSVRLQLAGRIAALCAATALAAGCAGSSTGTAAPPAATRVAAASPRAAAAQDPALDSRACLSVEALMGHLSSASARWSPTTDPFDPTMSARIQSLSTDLSAQVPLARSAPVREAISANARAFALLARRMTGKDETKVARAVDGTRVAYRSLKDVCAFDSD